jgi:uncharacterized RDD family membrane protein YckC
MTHGPDDEAVDPGSRISPVPWDARPYQGRRAGVVTRLTAGVLDAIVVGLVLSAGYFGLSFLLFLVNPRGFQLPRPGLVFGLTSAFVVAFVYFTVAWAMGGRTYGYLVMGLRVRRRSGRPLRLAGAAARALFVVLVPIGVLWVPVSRNNSSVQDIFLGTEVVYDWQPRTARFRPQV